MKNFAFNLITTLGLASLGCVDASAYTVQFYKGDSLLQRSEFSYGEYPEYEGNYWFYTDKYEYRIDRWEPSRTSVTGDAVYHAVLDSSIRRYSLYFYDDNGSTLSYSYLPYGSMPEYVGVIPTKLSSDIYDFTFRGWSGQRYDEDRDRWVYMSEGVDSLRGYTRYYPVFDTILKKFTVKFINYDGTVISEAEYPYGTSASEIAVPSNPTRASANGVEYTFSRWSPWLSDVTKNQVYVATYNASNGMYTVTFLDESGILQTGDYSYGAYVEYTGATPTKEPTEMYEYTFYDWSDDNYWYGYHSVYDNAVYTALFERDTRYYWIKYFDDDGTLLDSVQVSYNDMPYYYGDTKAIVMSEDYSFDKWDYDSYEPRLTCVNGDASYTLKYTYRVKFVLDDGTVLDRNWVDAGGVPVYYGSPDKAPTAKYAYEFAGWDKPFAPVTAPTTYTAMFKATPVPASPAVEIAVGESLTIDDFEDGDSRSELGTDWYTDASWTWNYGYTVTKDVVPSDNGTNVLKLSYSRPYEDYYTTKVGLHLSTSGAVDLSQCGAIQYDYRGGAHDFRVESDYGYSDEQYFKSFERSDDWKTVTFYWRDLGNEEAGVSIDVVQKHATQFVWDLFGTNETLEIDNVACLNKPRYVVKFYDEDGKTLIDSAEFALGETPMLESPALDRALAARTDNQYKANVKWSPELSAVTGNTSYTAVYDSSLKKYCVEYNDYQTDRWVECMEVEYGKIPDMTGVIPTQEPSDWCNEYMFDHWSTDFYDDNGDYIGYASELRPVQTNQRLYANFNCVDKKNITVTYKDNFGNVIRTDDMLYDTYIEYFELVKPSSAKYDYTFVNWDYNPEGWVYKPMTFTATFDSVVREYPVRFVDYDGNVLYVDGDAQKYYPYGTPLNEIAVPEDMSRAPANGVRYFFVGWIPAISDEDVLTGEMTFVANYAPSNGKYTVVFMNGSTILQSEDLDEGEIPEYKGSTPFKAADEQFTYSWDENDGWDKTVGRVTGATIYNAKFKETLRTYEVSFLVNGVEVYRNTYEYGATITDAPDMCEGFSGSECYTSGWYYYVDYYGSYYGLQKVTGSVAYFAYPSYKISFNNYEGTRAYSTSYSYGHNLSESMYWIDEEVAENISIPSSAQYEYTWNGKWDKDIARVTGPASYTVILDSALRRYEVAFVDEDGTVLKEAATYEYGTDADAIELPSVVPMKEADATASYAFAGWNVKAVTGNVTYVAQYKAIPKTYKISFVDNDEVITEDVYVYGTPAADIEVPSDMDKESQRFIGWSAEIADVTEDAVYTARYVDMDQFVVTWLDDDGTVLKQEVYDYGDIPSYDTTVTKKSSVEYSYTFTGWSPEITEVTADAIYIAGYKKTKRNYTVKFVNANGIPLNAMSYAYGTLAEDIEIPEDPVKESTESSDFVFVGWTPEITDVTGKAEYKAQFAAVPRYYTVSFMTADGYAWDNDTYQYGSRVDLSWRSGPSKVADSCSYEFVSWETEDEDDVVKGDRVYTPKYRTVSCIEKHVVKWYDSDSTLLDEGRYLDGETPVFKGKLPGKDTTWEYITEFAGWSPEVKMVSGEAEYYATYKQTKRVYTVTFLDADGAEWMVDTTAYGDSVYVPTNGPTKSFSNCTYEFAGWVSDDSSDVVMASKVYTPKYTEECPEPEPEKVVHTVEFYGYKGEVLGVFLTKHGDTLIDKEFEQLTDVVEGNCTYKFVGWSPENRVVTEDMEYFAQFEKSCREPADTVVSENDTVQTDSSIGIAPIAVQMAFKLGYANNVITVAQPSPAMVRVQVFDMNGQLVKSFAETVAGSRNFSLAQLKQGSYLVRVTSKSQVRSARVTVK